MSIEKIEMFTVVCDNCKKSVGENSDYSCWNGEDSAEEVAMNSEYIKEDKKHYCPDCFEYNGEDKLIIKFRELSTSQKLQALSSKYYDGLTWIPKKGDYYTTSRNDLELYQIVDENETTLFTNYCGEKKANEPHEWVKEQFLKDFGERRVFVPEFVLKM